MNKKRRTVALSTMAASSHDKRGHVIAAASYPVSDHFRKLAARSLLTKNKFLIHFGMYLLPVLSSYNPVDRLWKNSYPQHSPVSTINYNLFKYNILISKKHSCFLKNQY